jgi:hypothetical protein
MSLYALPSSKSADLPTASLGYCLLALAVLAFSASEMFSSDTVRPPIAMQVAWGLAMLQLARAQARLQAPGNRAARIAVNLAAVGTLAFLVWTQGRTNALHGVLLLAAVAAALIHRGDTRATACCAVVAAALHAAIVAGSGVTFAVQLQWLAIAAASAWLAIAIATMTERLQQAHDQARAAEAQLRSIRRQGTAMVSAIRGPARAA